MKTHSCFIQIWKISRKYMLILPPFLDNHASVFSFQNLTPNIGSVMQKYPFLWAYWLQDSAGFKLGLKPGLQP